MGRMTFAFESEIYSPCEVRHFSLILKRSNMSFSCSELMTTSLSETSFLVLTMLLVPALGSIIFFIGRPVRNALPEDYRDYSSY